MTAASKTSRSATPKSLQDTATWGITGRQSTADPKTSNSPSRPEGGPVARAIDRMAEAVRAGTTIEARRKPASRPAPKRARSVWSRMSAVVNAIIGGERLQDADVERVRRDFSRHDARMIRVFLDMYRPRRDEAPELIAVSTEDLLAEVRRRMSIGVPVPGTTVSG